MVTQKLSRNFTYRKYKGNIREAVEQEEKHTIPIIMTENWDGNVKYDSDQAKRLVNVKRMRDVTNKPTGSHN